MIAFIKGTVIHKDANFAIIDNNGLGFRVFLRPDVLANLKDGAEAQFFIHEYLRDNERELYGFPIIGELKLFWKLMTVSGVGPKMALHLLSLGYEKLHKAIDTENLAIISSVSGVGKKTAQKIILELRGKLKTDDGEVADDVADALVHMGYSRQDVAEALNELPADLEKIEDKLKAALKQLSTRASKH